MKVMKLLKNSLKEEVDVHELLEDIIELARCQ